LKGVILKLFLKKFLLVVKLTQSRFIFGTQKDSFEKIIWFYLVRAEVVLWWHCLIFFAPASLVPMKIIQVWPLLYFTYPLKIKCKVNKPCSFAIAIFEFPSHMLTIAHSLIDAQHE